ncbi:MAG: hypothetical protein PHV55_04090 [Candidatus Omnitrophica bacterium]|nr:hypothetical protein [Candidatus Omnitrophota bacterium]
MKPKSTILFLSVIMAGVVFGLTGCASLESPQKNHIGDTFIATNGKDSKLVRRNNDLYLERLDGSDSKRITVTPAVYESAMYSSNGKHIIYTEESGEKPIYAQDVRQAPYERHKITIRERDGYLMQ